MKLLFLTLLILLTICGCSAMRFSVNGGTARLAIPFDFPQPSSQKSSADLKDIYIGMPREDLNKAGFLPSLKKDYRQEGKEEWITFLNWTTEKPENTITFHLVDGKVRGWEEKR